MHLNIFQVDLLEFCGHFWRVCVSDKLRERIIRSIEVKQTNGKQLVLIIKATTVLGFPWSLILTRYASPLCPSPSLEIPSLEVYRPYPKRKIQVVLEVWSGSAIVPCYEFFDVSACKHR